MLRDMRRGAIVACALFISLAFSRPSTAAGAPPADAATLCIASASALNDQGAYARAKDMLEDFLSDPPAGVNPDEIEKARWLLIGVRSGLLDQYEGVVAAQRRAKDEAAARAREAAARQAEQKKTLAEADRLARDGEAGMNAGLLEQAARLRSRVASARALDAFQAAVDLYAEGNYLKAGRVLDRLRQWTQMQRAVDSRFRPGIGADREKRVTAYLARLDDLKANCAAAEALVKVHAAVNQFDRKEVVASIR